MFTTLGGRNDSLTMKSLVFSGELRKEWLRMEIPEVFALSCKHRASSRSMLFVPEETSTSFLLGKHV